MIPNGKLAVGVALVDRRDGQEMAVRDYSPTRGYRVVGPKGYDVWQSRRFLEERFEVAGGCVACAFPGEEGPPRAHACAPASPDNDITSPGHYKTGCGFEAVDVIEGFGLNWRVGNAVKYLLRHRKKGGIKDLQKAKWFIEREIEKYDNNGGEKK